MFSAVYVNTPELTRLVTERIERMANATVAANKAARDEAVVVYG
jgi:hypothetical protein